MPVALTELVVVRHGEAVCNVAGTVGGERGCTGLTGRGREQAARLADRLAVEQDVRPFNVVYVSPSVRARQTADAVVAVLGQPAIVETALRPPDHGEADGQLWAPVRDAFGGPPQHEPDLPFAPGSETWNQYLDRATECLSTILARHPGAKILVVGHVETVHASYSLLLDLPRGACQRLGFVTGHTAITRWQLHTNRARRSVWMLVAHNDALHVTGHASTARATSAAATSPAP